MAAEPPNRSPKRPSAGADAARVAATKGRDTMLLVESSSMVRLAS